MEYLEFQCSECRCGLRIRAEHREKTIRCPNCHALQRYQTPQAPTAPVWSAVASPMASLPPLAVDTGSWSLRTPEGLLLAQLSRAAFESEIRARNLGPGTWFQGGDYPQWTPLERLFQSQVPGRTPRTDVGGALSPPPVFPAPTPAFPPLAAPPLEQQMPSPRAQLVLALGVLGLFMPCSFVFSIVGLIFGVTDAIQIGNGSMSQQGSTMLTVGIVACILGLFLGGCCTISLLS